MSSVDILRSSIQSLDSGIHRNENHPSFTTSSPFSQSGHQSSVPVDHPLYVNTTMTAQQRISLYRRLAHPPMDGEPALLIRL